MFKEYVAFPLIELNRVNPKRLAKVDEIIKANGGDVACWHALAATRVHA